MPNSELSTEKVKEILYNITDLLNTVFPNTKVYPALGNHDYHPKNQMPPKSNDIYKALGYFWGQWLPQDAVDSFKEGKWLFCSMLIGSKKQSGVAESWVRIPFKPEFFSGFLFLAA